MRDEFAVCPCTAGGWDYIAGALGRLLARLAATGRPHCIVVASAPPFYLQFMIRPGASTWGEAIGDVNLPKPFDNEKRRRLLQLGWRPPDPDGRWSGNYVRESPPGEEMHAAVLALTTMVDVFDATLFDTVNVSVFESKAGRP